MAIFIAPHGIGYRFSIGHVDVPRLIVLTLITYWFVVYCGLFQIKNDHI